MTHITNWAINELLTAFTVQRSTPLRVCEYFVSASFSSGTCSCLVGVLCPPTATQNWLSLFLYCLCACESISYRSNAHRTHIKYLALYLSCGSRSLASGWSINLFASLAFALSLLRSIDGWIFFSVRFAHRRYISNCWHSIHHRIHSNALSGECLLSYSRKLPRHEPTSSLLL